MATREEMRKELIRAVYDSPSNWHAACIKAARNGWTEDEVQSILNRYHPLTHLVGGIVIFTIGAMLWSAIF
jgi:hypothetical protein